MARCLEPGFWVQLSLGGRVVRQAGAGRGLCCSQPAAGVEVVLVVKSVRIMWHQGARPG